MDEKKAQTKRLIKSAIEGLVALQSATAKNNNVTASTITQLKEVLNGTDARKN